MMRILWLTFLICLQLFSSNIEFTEEEKRWIEKNQPITYVGDPDWLPFEAFNSKGEYEGIVADLLKHIQKISPLKFKIIKTSSWQDSIDTMNSGKIMLMSQSQDFNKQSKQLFSEIYYKNPIVIIMDKKHHFVSSLYSIENKKIAINSTGAFLKKIKNKYPTIKFKLISSTQEGLQSVAFGKNDAFIDTLAQTSYAIAKLQLNDLRIVGRTEFNTKLGFGIKKENPLLKSIINKTIKSISPSIKNKILSKWIHQKYIEKPNYSALYIALAIFTFIFIMATIFYTRVKRETQAKLQAQYKMLEQQSKMASMGEMLDAIAHQWKQPLNALSMYLDLMKNDFENGIVDKKYIDEMQDATHSQITHMLNTLKEFRNFFRPNTEVVDFKLLNVINSLLLLTKDEFLKNQISIEVYINEDIKVKGNENEFKHLILNIINNSKDAFNERDIKDRHIVIRALQNKTSLLIEIEDSAGGIPKHIIDHIFESNFTTKTADNGTGIGLYMSLQIVEKMNGKISVKNINNGACFYINFSIV